MLRVISYNIRYNNPADGVNAWPRRQARVAGLLRRYEPDLIGLQEVRHDQLMTLAAALPEYSWFGVGRDDGAEAGEYAPVFYRHNRFMVQDHGHFWLSATPGRVGSFGWDAACVRIATWVRLTDRRSNVTLLHLNTHLDHHGITAQLESVKLLHAFLADQAATIPAVVTGDFNCTPGSATYQALTAPSLTSAPTLSDAMTASVTPHEGPTATFTTDFSNPLQEKIDYIFLSTGLTTETDLMVRHHAILADQTAGRYPSDHLPVLTELVWPQG
ncbi:MAG: endonuclease/exonuclease/phosphatase family protein [Caldilineaceae bacterium]